MIRKKGMGGRRGGEDKELLLGTRITDGNRSRVTITSSSRWIELPDWYCCAEKRRYIM